MKLAIGEQCSSISGGQHRSQILFCLSFLLVTGNFGQAFSKSTVAYEPAVTINVLVYNYAHVSSRNLAAAERQANEILAGAGVKAVWVDCLDDVSTFESKELCQKGWTRRTPELRLLSGHVTSQFKDSEFGFARIPACATVSYEHVLQRAERDNEPLDLPILLGAVIAHELGHLLLGDPNHSGIGIMQPKWGFQQIQQARCGRLRFTSDQTGLIRARLRTLSSLPVEVLPNPEVQFSSK